MISITNIQLQTAWGLLPNTNPGLNDPSDITKLTIGDKKKALIDVEIDGGSTLSDFDTLYFNPKLFGQLTPPVTSDYTSGWTIPVSQLITGTTVPMAFYLSGAIVVNQNISASVIKTSDTTFQICFEFYVTADTHNFVGAYLFSNANRLKSRSMNRQSPNVYNSQSWACFLVNLRDSDGINTSTVSSFAVEGCFYDEGNDDWNFITMAINTESCGESVNEMLSQFEDNTIDFGFILGGAPPSSARMMVVSQCPNNQSNFVEDIIVFEQQVTLQISQSNQYANVLHTFPKGFFDSSCCYCIIVILYDDVNEIAASYSVEDVCAGQPPCCKPEITATINSEQTDCATLCLGTTNELKVCLGDFDCEVQDTEVTVQVLILEIQNNTGGRLQTESIEIDENGCGVYNYFAAEGGQELSLTWRILLKAVSDAGIEIDYEAHYKQKIIVSDFESERIESIKFTDENGKTITNLCYAEIINVEVCVDVDGLDNPRIDLTLLESPYVDQSSIIATLLSGVSIGANCIIAQIDTNLIEEGKQYCVIASISHDVEDPPMQIDCNEFISSVITIMTSNQAEISITFTNESPNVILVNSSEMVIDSSINGSNISLTIPAQNGCIENVIVHLQLENTDVIEVLFDNVCDASTEYDCRYIQSTNTES